MLEVSSIKSMGFGFVYKKVMKDRRVPIESKAIYNYIASYAGAGNTAFPGWKLISYDLKISKDRYYRFMRYLKAYGYITIRQKKNADSTFSNNIYTLQEFPEQYEDAKIIKEILEEEVKSKRKPPKKKTGSSLSGNGPVPDSPETEIPETEHQETNSISTNSILLYISTIWSYAQEVLNKDLPDNEFMQQLTLFSFEDNCFVFTVTDDWYKSIIEIRYVDRIKLALIDALKIQKINILSFDVMFRV